MPPRNPIRPTWLVACVALAVPWGCSSLPSRPPAKAPSSILDPGPQPRITGRQSADIHYAVGRSQEQEKKYDEARTSYLAALKLDPKRADAELRLAILDDRKGDEAGADGHYARALKLDPKNPEIYCDRGYSLYLRRRWADAEASLKQALALDKNHARSHSNLGLVLARRGESEAALAEFARAGCDRSDSRANLGLILAMEGHFEEARREYALSLEAKPDSTLAKEGLRASTVALAGLADPKPIAAGDGAVSRAEYRTKAAGTGTVFKSDPDLIRTSAQATTAGRDADPQGHQTSCP